MTDVKSIDEFLELPLDEQRGYLRHPAWARRCRCKKYGFPWDSVMSVIGDDEFRHTGDLCAPTIEFI